MADSISGLFDPLKLKGVLDGFWKVTGITVALVDSEGNLFATSERPGLCTCYYDDATKGNSCRVNRINFLDSVAKGRQPDKESCLVCTNGLTEAIEPIFMEEKLLGGLLIGQVFTAKPDIESYRKEASRFGFDEEGFVKALEAVPVLPEEQFRNARQLMTGLTSMLVEQGLARHKAEQNEKNALQHAERLIREMRRQRIQLQIYAMNNASCSDLLDTILEKTLQITDSSVAYLFEYDEDSCLLSLYGTTLSQLSRKNLIHYQTVFGLQNSGLWGEAIRQRRPVINNRQADPDSCTPGYPGENGDLARHLNIPIFSNGRIVAVMIIGNKESDYTEVDLRHLELFLNGSWNLVERRKAEDELKMAKELAESSLKVKSELLATLSHELRTPLNGIIGGSQLLRFTELTEEQDVFLQMIEETSANELMLVNNLLELVRLESEGIHADNAPFSLKSCINESLLVIKGTAQAKGIELRTVLPAELPEEVYGDKVRIRQILYSLLGNAVKFTPEGAVTLIFTCNHTEEDRIQARFCVKDTGIGISPEKLADIFEPFVQADMSKTRVFGGLGLGLAICRHLAALLGGSICAESVPGEGSSFYFDLPLRIYNDTAKAGFTRPGLRILLVEDDHLSASAGESLLNAMGHIVTTACNGEDAISKWEKGNFDTILMDIHMPVMDGFEALQKIRIKERELGRPRLPVIAQTAYARLNYHESFLSSDFDGFISKPLLRNELELTLSNLSGNSAAHT